VVRPSWHESRHFPSTAGIAKCPYGARDNRQAKNAIAGKLVINMPVSSSASI